jgi:hypothetical protein
MGTNSSPFSMTLIQISAVLTGGGTGSVEAFDDVIGGKHVSIIAPGEHDAGTVRAVLIGYVTGNQDTANSSKKSPRHLNAILAS